MSNEKGEIRFRDVKEGNSLEILLPAGLTSKELSKITLGDLISKFRPSGCGACLSGQHLIIRERFERVLPVDITAGKVHM